MMCGIASIITKYPSKEHMDILAELTSGMHHRGVNGTGIFTKQLMNKESLPPASYVQDKSFKDIAEDFARGTEPDFAVIHNRSGFGGPVKDLHPFVHGNICGCHNGWVGNAFHLAGKNFRVDSDAVMYCIERDGIEVVNKFDGAFVLSWVNYSDNTLHFIRNGGNTYYMVQDDEGTIYGASEKHLLLNTLHRHNVDVAEDEVDLIEPYVEYIYKDGVLVSAFEI